MKSYILTAALTLACLAVAALHHIDPAIFDCGGLP